MDADLLPHRRRLLSALCCTAWPLPSAAQQPLQVAFVYVGPVGEAGWTFAHDSARQALEASFGNRIRVTTVASVREGSDAERALRDLVAQGNKLVFATSFGYMDALLRVAAEHPQVRFEHATGYKTAANLRTYDARAYEPAYLAGMMAGGLTRSGVLGVVGALPLPAVLLSINAFTLGALSVNPAARTRVVWINEWFNPPRETEAAQSLINLGADILMQTTDSPAALEVAERSGKLGFGLASDMSRFARKAHLGSIVYHWAPYCTKAVRDVLEQRWSTGQSWWGMKEGAVDLVGVPDSVPAALRLRVEEVRHGLRAGSFDIWRGPLMDNRGRQVLGPQQLADDAFLRRMSFYVKGVEGQLPS